MGVWVHPGLQVFLYDFEEHVVLFPLLVSCAASVLKGELLVWGKPLGFSLQLWEMGSLCAVLAVLPIGPRLHTG